MLRRFAGEDEEEELPEDPVFYADDLLALPADGQEDEADEEAPRAPSAALPGRALRETRPREKRVPEVRFREAAPSRIEPAPPSAAAPWSGELLGAAGGAADLGAGVPAVVKVFEWDHE